MGDFASPDLRVMRAMHEMQKNREQKADAKTISGTAPAKTGRKVKTNDRLREMGIPEWKIEKMSRADRRRMAKESRREKT